MSDQQQPAPPQPSNLAGRVKKIRENLIEAGHSQNTITPMERALTEAMHDVLGILDDLSKGIDPGTY